MARKRISKRPNQAMAANLKNDAVDHRLEEVNLYISNKQRRLNRLYKLLYTILP